MCTIDYCDDANGRKPVEEFIDGLDLKMQVKVFGNLALLEQYGNRLSMPFSQHLEDGIYELRTSQGNNITRVLYFFLTNKRILLTHGFTKKTQKTPRREIERAKQIRANWKDRNNE